MTVSWDELLCVFLHDPPDKVLAIQKDEQRAIAGHETRTREYLRTAGVEVSGTHLKKLKGGADQLAAIAERLPLPNTHHVNADPSGILTVYHPLAASEVRTGGPIDPKSTASVFFEIAGGLADPQQRFLALWRLLPERLNKRVGPWFARLPAETRVPDHTIWHHIDLTAGLYAADFEGPEPKDWCTEGGAFLSFHIGPVQPFVAAACSVRDLWTGSALLSWLTFRAMLPIIEDLGPTALVFPSLRGAPLLDRWLRHALKLGDVPPPAVEARQAPSIPNRFLAVVPWGGDGAEGRRLAAACEDAARQAWKTLASKVKGNLDPKLSKLCRAWGERWDEQIGDYFDVRTSLMPAWQAEKPSLASLLGHEKFCDAWPDAEQVRALNDCIPCKERPGYEQKDAGRWQAQVEMAGRLMEATRAIRQVPPSAVRGSSSDQQFPNK